MIPQGYKHTELGIIPQEWEILPLSALGRIYSGGTPDTTNPKFWNGEILWCTLSDITSLSSNYISDTETKITEEGLKRSPAIILPAGSLIVCTRATIGNIAIATKSLSTNQGFKNIVPNSDINTAWLFYNLIYAKNRLVKLGCGSTFLEVSKKDFERFKVPVPPMEEQRKIAEILGVWDKAIELQARLIDQLELRKHGLMQRLFSGRHRLPGFSEKWISCKINKIAKIKKGEQVNKDVLFSNAKFPVINGGITPSGYLDIYNTEANTITISEGGNSCGYINFMTTPFWSGGHCYTINVNAGINNLLYTTFLNIMKNTLCLYG